jgi:hypothetical protein
MGEKVQLKGGIYEVNVGYNAKMEVYANSSSDIPKINKISPLTLRNFAYLADMRFSLLSKSLRHFAYPLCRYRN